MMHNYENMSFCPQHCYAEGFVYGNLCRYQSTSLFYYLPIRLPA